MKMTFPRDRQGWWILLAALLITALIYWPGLSGGFLFDDFPNIVDNHGVQPGSASLASLIRAALSSPSSEFKRPLASLSFAANYLASGLDPVGMKATNLAIHLINGLLVFLVSRKVIRLARGSRSTERLEGDIAARHAGFQAALISTGWMLLPINLTAVLYVVQRMESLANLFVLLGLLGYLSGRRKMLLSAAQRKGGLTLSISSVLGCTALGLFAKETAIMLPLYAGLAEWVLFGFRTSDGKLDRTVVALYCATLLLPLCLGAAWLLPQLLQPEAWATRDFTLKTRLLSEARIVCDYIVWSLLPTPKALSFYHDDFVISQSLTSPWTTLLGVIALCTLTASSVVMKRRWPVASLGILWFLGAHLLTATILPLELVYEHRNYFASFGLLLALVPSLAALSNPGHENSPVLQLPRRVLLGCLVLSWAGLTAITAQAWGNPLRLAEELAARATQSPRAQYELGRTYIIASHYDPSSPFIKLAYGPLERAAAIPGSSILPEQAMIFMNARMHLPLRDAWWASMIAKLKAHKATVQDESSLGALTQCVRDGLCDLPRDRMLESFLAALSHPNPSARLLALYGDYAWNVMQDKSLGLSVTEAASRAAPKEAAYLETLVKMNMAMGNTEDAKRTMDQLRAMNLGGQLNIEIQKLDSLMR